MTEPFSEQQKRIEATTVGRRFVAAGFRLEAKGGALGWYHSGDPEIRIYDADSGCGMTEDGSETWSVMVYDGPELIEELEASSVETAIGEARRWL